MADLHAPVRALGHPPILDGGARPWIGRTPDNDPPPPGITLRVRRAPASEEVTGIGAARQRLDSAEQRVLSLRMTLESVSRDAAGYGSLVKRLHLLERSVFSRRLELDELLRERRRHLGTPAGRL